MQDSNKFIKILLKGKEEYECLVSPELIITNVHPMNDYLLGENLNVVYSRFKNDITINILGLEEPTELLNEDIYEAFKAKNKSIELLKNIFNCEL